MTTIEVNRLVKTYQVPVREEGLRAALRSLRTRTVRDVLAVHDVSFALEAGETVGFIGPNGAGKTTTLKVLCGILTPTSGDVRVLGHRPWDREPRFLRQIALIRGSQPIAGPPELTVLDALRLQQLVYEVDDAAFSRNLGQLAGMLSLGPLLDRQIRALSLGERMRCGLAIALLYRPRVLFLDEPTIGMDVSVVEQTRRFIREYTAETKATTLLTSHYMADVEQLCPRIILINGGVLAFDGPLARLTALHASHHHITVTVENASAVDWTRFGDLVAVDAGRARLRAPRERIPAIARDLLAALPVLDLGIEEEPLETVIDRVYRQGLERREDVACAG